MTPLLLPSGATPFALLPAFTATHTSAPALTLVEKLPRWKFQPGAHVFAATEHYELGIGGYSVVRSERRHQIARRERRRDRDGQYVNWYTVVGFPFMFRESDLSVKQRYKQVTYTRRMIAAA